MKPNRKKQPARHQSLFDSSLPLRRVLNLAILAALYPSFSYANPDGAQIVSGQVSIDTATPGVTTVTNNPNAIINWQNFSIAQHELTQFIQQNGQSAVLNRIIGQNPSEILGQLTSNGKVFLINPNGIVFGPGSTVDTQGLIASSLNLSDQDFLSGNYHFMAGSSAGNILNEGIIRAGKDGNIILIAPKIENNGIIKSEGGSITLAAGQELTITNLDNPDIRFQVQAPADSVLNLGKLLTEGGAINVFAGAIKHSGEINADSVEVDAQGNIRLVAQQDITLASDSKISANNSQGDAGIVHIESKTGTTLAQGMIEAQASETGKGGNIELLGERVGVLNQAHIDASGKNGGGQVLIGGDYQGKNPDIHNAKATYVGKNASIKADAKATGDGGKVIAWADDTTRAYGSISAKGGTQSGNGGFIETSGRRYLDVEGIHINASAANGATGTWLLDPNDIQIIHAADSGSDVNINGANPFAQYSDTANSTISDYTLNQAISGYANVSLTTSSNGSSGSGDILFDSSSGSVVLSKNSADASSTTLTFNAYHDIKFLSSTNSTTIETNTTTGADTGNLIVVFNPGTGKAIVNNGATLNLNGQRADVEAQISGGKIWENSGTINMLGKSVIRPYLSSLSTFNNLNGGVLNISSTSDSSFLSNSNQEGIINNAGTINVNQSTSWEAKFSQTTGGIVNLHNGLSIKHLDVAAGTINIDSGITLWIPEVHTGLNKFDSAFINGPGRLQIGLASSDDYSPTVTFNNASTSNLTILREEKGTLAFSGTNAFANTKFFANGTTNLDWSIPTATYTGNIEWWAKGNVTLSNNLSTTGNITLGAGWNANIATPLSTSTGTITNNAALSAVNVTLKAGKMALAGGTISGSSSVGLSSINAIDVGAITTGDALSTLELSNAELNTVTTPILRIGDSSSGAIDIKSALGNALSTDALKNISTALNLTSGGAITQQAGATIAALPGLNLSGASVALPEANPEGVISGAASTGDFRYRSSNLLTVATVDGISGITVPVAKDIALLSDSASGINQQSGANLSGGNLALKAVGPVSLINSGNNISTIAADLSGGTGGFNFLTGSNLTVTSVLSADGSTTLDGISTNNQSIGLASTSSININRPINAGTASVDLKADALTWDAAGVDSGGRVVAGVISVRPYTANRTITVGSATCSVSSCLSITELWKITAPTIGIGSHSTGAIYVDGITNSIALTSDRNAATTRIGLISNAGITQSATAINVQDLGIDANGAVTLNTANSITNLAAKTSGQNVTFNNGQSFTLAQMSGGTAPYDYSVNGINTYWDGTYGNVALTTTGSITPNAPLNANIFTLVSGTWNQINASLPAFSAVDFRISGGTFIRALGGDGSSGNPYQLTDVYGLQGIGSTGMLNKYYMLSNNITAGGTSAWNNAAGFSPIGVFTGTFDGREHTISGLNINRPATSNIGLFGSTGSGSTVKNVGLTGISVTGYSDVGGLVGLNNGDVKKSYATGAVTGNNQEIGGLIGRNNGGVDASYVSAMTVAGQTASTSNDDDIGGLIGYNNGTIIYSSSAGTVTGVGDVGGLVGHNSGALLDQSYSTMNVTSVFSAANDGAGGLVGWNSGPITNSYATGSVYAGDNSQGVGGLVGTNFSSSITNSYSSGSVTTGINALYVGGLVGLNNGTVNVSFWDTQSSSQPTIGIGSGTTSGASGLTTANMKTLSNFVNWNFSTIWRMYDGYTAPLLKSFLTPITVTASNANKTYDGLAHSGGSGATYSNSGATLLGTLFYSGSSQGAVNAGSYSITPSGLYSNQHGYDISFTSGTLVISPTTLNITANSLSKAYGDADPVLTYNAAGFVNGESSSVLTGALTRTAGETVVGGPYAINQGSLTSSNYTLNYTGASLTINPAVLSITANSLSKAYGDSNPTLTASATGLKNGDTSLIITGLSTIANISSGVGNYLINASAASAGSNYTITAATNGSLTVKPAILNITANSSNKTYGALDPVFSYKAIGFVNGESSSLLTGALTRTAGESVAGGPYAINQGSLAAGGNYNINYTGAVFTITPAQLLSVKADNATRVYGDANPIFTGNFISGGLVNGDTLDSIGLTYASLATPFSNVGIYAITPKITSSNYTFVGIDGQLSVTPHPLDVTAIAASKTYGDLDPVFIYNATGFVNGETSAVLTGSLVREAGETVAGGPYDIHQGSLSGSNYNINYTEAYLTINPPLAEQVNDTVTDSIEKVTAVVVGTITSGSGRNNESNGSNESTENTGSSVVTNGSSDSKTGKGKNAKECTK